MWYMHRIEIEVVARSSADAASLFALLADGASWPDWSPIGSVELEAPGEGAPEGPGAIRVFRTGLVRSREQLVEVDPPSRLSYVLLSGLPVRHYRADVTLEAVDGGTVVRWHSGFNPKIPGTGWFFRRFLGTVIRRCATGLAGRRGPAGPSPPAAGPL